jgi:hypothetical protein
MPRSRLPLLFRRALVGVCLLFLALPGSARNKKSPKPCDRPALLRVPPVTGPSISKPPPGKPPRECKRPPRPPLPDQLRERWERAEHLPLPYPRPEYYYPWDFYHLLQYDCGQAVPPEPCCRRLSPCTVTYRGTGRMNFEPWDYTVLPCDYGERFVDPIDKTCRTAKDCVMIPVPWDCCGSLMLAGINKGMSRQYARLNHACRRVLKWCSCPAGSYRAEDFRTTDNPADIRLGCVRGMCRTSLP